MKPKTFQTRGVLIEARKDFNGIYYICWKPHVSVIFSVRADLIRWYGYTKGLPTRVALDEWLDSLTEAPLTQKDPTLLKEQSWGPEAHDDDGPTKMIT